MASTLAVTFTFDADVCYHTTSSIPPVTASLTFGSARDVEEFLEAYTALYKGQSPTVPQIIDTWLDAVCAYTIQNVKYRPITLA